MVVSVEFYLKKYLNSNNIEEHVKFQLGAIPVLATNGSKLQRHTVWKSKLIL